MPGGGSDGTVDTAYNSRMASIAEEQQAMANQMFQYWQKGPGSWTSGSTSTSDTGTPTELGAGTSQTTEAYVPGGQYNDRTGKVRSAPNASPSVSSTSYTGTGLAAADKTWVSDPGAVSQMQQEQAQIKANLGLIPVQTENTIAGLNADTSLIPQRTGLESAQIGSALKLLPGQTALTQAQIDSTMKLLPGQTALTQAQLDEQQRLIKERAPVSGAFYNAAVNGVDVGRRVGLAQADVQSSFKNADSERRRWASRYGINPNSGKFLSGLAADQRSKAATMAGATSLARRTAEDENFKRLSAAMGVG